MKREGSKKQRHKRGKPEPGTKLSGPLDEDDLDEEELGDFYDDFPWMESVLKVYCTHAEPNYSLPWQMKRQHSSSGSGFAIEGRRILTNAHCINHHTQVKVKKRGSDTKFVANVAVQGMECDLAVLTVADEEFWEDLEAVQFGELPSLQDPVTVVGYPIGGETISVTSGVVSRIEVQGYSHGAADLLGIQIDAAINAGNSGGPAFGESGDCIGVAFQSLKGDDAENIGYVIPTAVIQHFLMDFEKNGAYTGFPRLAADWQKLENPSLRAALGMSGKTSGIRIKRVNTTSPMAEVLKPDDVLLEFDSVKISNDGSIPFRKGERISFTYLISQKFVGDDCSLTILRDGQKLQVTSQVDWPHTVLPVKIRKKKQPSYCIVAGLVFTPVCEAYLRSEYGDDYDFDAPVKLLEQMMHALPTQRDQQVVVLAHVLASEITIGYEEITNNRLIKFNGTQVNNLTQLWTMLEACTDDFLRFELEFNEIVVLNTQAARAATQDVLTTHCIPAEMSSDLKRNDSIPKDNATPAAAEHVESEI